MASTPVSRVSSIFRKGLFNNRVAVVTGGSTGIGKAITLELLYLGCKVVIASRNEERLLKVANEMSQSFPSSEAKANVMAIPCNIRMEDQVENLVSKTLTTYGKIDFLVNNGGGQFMSLIKDITLKGWRAVIETNLTGTFLMSKQVYNCCMKDHGGAIVNIIAAVHRGTPRIAHTCAARAAVHNLTQSMCLEWAASGVRINDVIPYPIYSPTAAENYEEGEALFKRAAKITPARRVGTPEEVSAAVCYLLSPAAAFITGSAITVDGGAGHYKGTSFEIPEHNKLPAYEWAKDVNDAKKD